MYRQSLFVGRRRQSIGGLYEIGRVCPIVVTKRLELARHCDHGIHRVDQHLNERDDGRPFHLVGDVATFFTIEPRRLLDGQAERHGGDRVVVMINDDCSQTVSLDLGESLVLLKVVESGDTPPGCERVPALPHSGLGPPGKTGQPKPKGARNAVVVESRDALMHDHI